MIVDTNLPAVNTRLASSAPTAPPPAPPASAMTDLLVVRVVWTHGLDAIAVMRSAAGGFVVAISPRLTHADAFAALAAQAGAAA